MLLEQRTVIQADPGFYLPDGDYTTRLAHRANQTGNHLLTLKLLNGFSKHYPGHPDIPSNYLTIARLLCERQGKDEQALKVLKGLSKTYKNHELSAEIESYMLTVQSVVEGR